MTTANALFETRIPYTVLYRRFLLYKYLPINTKFVSLNLYFNTYLFHISASFYAKLHSTSLSNYLVFINQTTSHLAAHFICQYCLTPNTSFGMEIHIM